MGIAYSPVVKGSSNSSIEILVFFPVGLIGPGKLVSVNILITAFRSDEIITYDGGNASNPVSISYIMHPMDQMSL